MTITWQTTKPSWEPLVEAPQDAPSIVLVVLDDTGFAHLSVALGVKALTLFMDSPVMAYGKYSERMSVIEPEGEKNSTSHDTLGSERISFEKTLLKAKEILV